MTTIPFTDLKSQYTEAKEDIDAAIQYCIDGNHFVTGPVTDQFENTIAEYTGAQACAATSSGSTALLCALLACDIGKGDEVITTAHSFVSTAEAILQVGATPVFVDVDHNYLIDVNKIGELVTHKTKAILFVDTYGQTPDIDRLKEHNILLIEDAAQSFGAMYKGQRVGDLVDLTCFSFNPVKNLGAMGDAGAITGDKELIDKARMYRDHGRKDKWLYHTMGYNARIDNIQAKIIEAKLPYLDNWLERKRTICTKYNEVLNEDKFITPRERIDNTHTWHVYVIMMREIPGYFGTALERYRDDFITYMSDNGIQCNIHYRVPLTRQPAYAKYQGYCDNAERIAHSVVSLPCYHSLTDEQQNYIIETANGF
jgi:dTDP-4-amino-4,6-dideoxygalactose transaminase